MFLIILIKNDRRSHQTWSYYYFLTNLRVEPMWRSGSVMDCHATAQGSVPSGNGVKTELHVLHKGQ